MEHLYLSEAVRKKDSFMIRFKGLHRRLAHNKLWAKACESTKGELHRLLTVNYKVKGWHKYLDILEPKNTQTLARFRMRGNRLANEVGGWLRMPKENRVCAQCLTYEDEIHVLKECPKYDEIRTQYLSFVTEDCRYMNEAQMIKYLLNNNCKRKLDNVCIFIRKAMVIHAEFAQQYMEIEEFLYDDEEEAETNAELDLI